MIPERNIISDKKGTLVNHKCHIFLFGAESRLSSECSLRSAITFVTRKKKLH